MEKDIDNTLDALQGIVGGYIELPYLGDVFVENGIDVIINEEGKFIDGLRPEIVVIRKETNQLLDIVYGNCVFASHDNDGNTTALSVEQELIVLDEFMDDVVLTDSNGKEFVAKVLYV